MYEQSKYRLNQLTGEVELIKKPKKKIMMTREEKYRALENAYIQQGAILEAIEQALDGAEVSDFMQSFGIVRRVVDLVYLSKK